MRARAMAVAVMCVGLGSAGVASAWTDPAGNMIINAPRGWTVEQQRMQGGSLALAFSPSSDCYFMGIPNPASANASVSAVQRSVTPLTPQIWTQAAGAISDFAGAEVVSQSVDTGGFWPVQRAQLRAGDRTIQAVVTQRPGFELRGFCTGPDASYDAILNSLGHPNDATWQSQPAAPATSSASTPPSE